MTADILTYILCLTAFLCFCCMLFGHGDDNRHDWEDD